MAGTSEFMVMDRQFLTFSDSARLVNVWVVLDIKFIYLFPIN